MALIVRYSLLRLLCGTLIGCFTVCSSLSQQINIVGDTSGQIVQIYDPPIALGETNSTNTFAMDLDRDCTADLALEWEHKLTHILKSSRSVLNINPDFEICRYISSSQNNTLSHTTRPFFNGDTLKCENRLEWSNASTIINRVIQTETVGEIPWPDGFIAIRKIAGDDCGVRYGWIEFKSNAVFQWALDKCGNEYSGSSIKIFPNPVTNGRIHVLNYGTQGRATLQISNCTGQTIDKIELISPHQIIDVRSIPSGVYYLLIENESISETKKLIVH